MVTTQGKQVSTLSKGYLFVYNVIQTLGWFYIFAVSCLHFMEEKSITSQGLYPKVEIPLKLFQTAAVFEIIHCAIGIVPSSAATTAMQVFSRLCTVWLFTIPVSQVQNNFSVLLYLLAWCITEVIRYSFYACSLLNCLPFFLQWCRYTFFIILYPIGVTGEMLTVAAAIPFVKKTEMYSLSLPNQLNVSFSLLYFMYFCLLVYIPAFLMLYSYMFRQRKKAFGRNTGRSTKHD
ncbi:very-long-chain (3R)-3-hydroxyacyl-CoA dehydratase 1-like [Xenia sp. Carnegie-2017]|uniref:very-long-chain (3R)-3-hydroxyacyl-CoA dehydratase 1-like n=1 Tax=Xenia sp. Carnegie-2017 TaxID=2897299 RepID=UPI001F03C2A3|nr:very-long-chain (3R)-3-hydroxyacyl-CoA dehydratase 1-like [Xenia sp. Carnegie-2017]